MAEKSESHSSGGILHPLSIFSGGLVHTQDAAKRLAELYLELHYRAEMVERQRPFIIVDKGDHWRIEGSWNRDRKIEGYGHFFMSVQKYDGRVTDFGVWLAYHPTPEATRIIAEHQRQQDRKKSGDTE